MSKLDKQGLSTLVTELNKDVNTKVNKAIDGIDLTPLATKTEVNNLKTTVESNNSTLTTSIENLSSDINTEIDKKIDKVGGQFEGAVKAQSNVEYTTAQIRNVILSTEDPDTSLGSNGDIWIKYK
jgi:septation ring formation regulator EzrA